jgi:hypothetical protein
MEYNDVVPISMLMAMLYAKINNQRSTLELMELIYEQI